MPRYGLTDITDFAEKIRFTLLLLSPNELIKKIYSHGGQLTLTTLNAWRAGQNLPSYNKLKQLCWAANIDPVDFHTDIETFMKRICARNHISEQEYAIYAERFRELSSPKLNLRILQHQQRDTTQTLFQRLQGSYLAYNISLNNLHRVHIALLSFTQEEHPFITVCGKRLKGSKLVTYAGRAFVARNNLMLIIESVDSLPHDIATIMLCTPMESNNDIDFLQGVILSAAEDHIVYPAAAHMYLERISDTIETDEDIRALLNKPAPAHCMDFIMNKISGALGDSVLSSRLLTQSEVEQKRRQHDTHNTPQDPVASSAVSE